MKAADMIFKALLSLTLSVCIPLAAQRPVHTYSIVARDPATGGLGVAVQSHWFSVGAIVPWAEAGVGAIATQSLVDPSYGPLGLTLMRAGKTAPEALRALVAGDANAEVRQVAFIDAAGRVAVHTGARAIQAAGHQTGRNYSVQANLMLKPTVPEAMSRAFERAKGDLTERLLVALEAAQAEGGDIRGAQSAALVVVSGKPTGRPWTDRLFDRRVEDHPEPLKELRRLVGVTRAYQHMNAGDEAVTRKDMKKAAQEYAAAETLPDSATNGELVFWRAVALVNAGNVSQALPLFRRAFAQDSNWVELVRRLPKAGLLPDDQAVLGRIVAANR